MINIFMIHIYIIITMYLVLSLTVADEGL